MGGFQIITIFVWHSFTPNFLSLWTIDLRSLYAKRHLGLMGVLLDGSQLISTCDARWCSLGSMLFLPLLCHSRCRTPLCIPVAMVTHFGHTLNRNVASSFPYSASIIGMMDVTITYIHPFNKISSYRHKCKSEICLIVLKKKNPSQPAHLTPYFSPD